MLKVFLSSDHVTAATGKTVAITISKNGGAFGNPNAGATNATEVSSGWYKVTLDTTDTNTVGDLVVRGTSASCDDSEQVLNVQAGIEQTGDSFARLGAPVGASVSADLVTVAGYIDTEVAAIKTVTDQFVAVQAEPGQGAPAVNASPLTKIAYLYKNLRNKKTQTASLWSLYADDATTVDQKATVTNDGTTATKAEIASGP